VFLDPDFLEDAKITAIRSTFKTDIGLLNICVNFHLGLKRRFWRTKWVRGGAILTSNELDFPFGGSYVSANFGENRSRNATVAVPTDEH